MHCALIDRHQYFGRNLKKEATGISENLVPINTKCSHVYQKLDRAN